MLQLGLRDRSISLASLLPRAVRRHGLPARSNGMWRQQQQQHLHTAARQGHHSSQGATAPTLRVRWPLAPSRTFQQLPSRMYTTGQQGAGTAAAAAGRSSSNTGLKALAALCVAGGAVAGTVYWLGFELEDLEELFGLGKKQEEPEVVLPPALPPPDEFVHPFDLRPWYWRYWFMFCRFVYLLYVFTPVTLAGLYLGIFHRDDMERSQKWCEWLVRQLNEAGCSMQKFGQWISMRPDMFAPELIQAMSHLREHAPTHSFEVTRKTFEEAIGKKLEDVFESFDPVPVASGTVAQVYHAVLRPEYEYDHGTREVAVKVRHPNVLAETYFDVWFITKLMPLASMFGPTLSFPFTLDTFYSILQKQVDFKWEAYHLSKFIRNFAKETTKDRETVVFPRVNHDLVRDTILVETWSKGVTVASLFPKLRRRGVDEERGWDRAEKDDENVEVQRRLSRRVADLSFKMFLRDNYVHGDLHAGNLLYDKDTDTLTVIDVGLITSIEPDMASSFGDFLRALVNLDPIALAERLMKFHNAKAVAPGGKQPVYEEVRKEMETIFAPFQGIKADLGVIMGDVIISLSKLGLIMRDDIAGNITTMSISEGLILSLDPDLDLVKMSLPYFVRYRGWQSTKQIVDFGYTTDTSSTQKTLNMK